jgi:P4 family phage/plasmid primase-like protien
MKMPRRQPKSRTLKPWAFDERAHVEEIISKHGHPVQKNAPAAHSFNEDYYAGEFVSTHQILFESSEKDFYSYCEENGLWKKLSEESVKREIAQHLNSLRKGIHEQMVPPTTENRLRSLLQLSKLHSEREDIFSRSPHIGQFVHVTNGMLDVRSRELKTFSPEWYSRNQIPLVFDPVARCPRFLDFLLNALNEEDVDLFQRWLGLVILGTNISQKIAIFHGLGGTGKTTLVRIVQMLAGLDNCAELRTEHLGRPFEMADFFGRVLLCGADVPGNFLMQKGAHKLKALTGGELMHAEIKRKGRCSFHGIFNIAITCNSTLRVRLDGDAEAWRRRLILFAFNRPPSRVIPNLAESLLREEGSGILNWALEGSSRALAELESDGRMVLTPNQKTNIEDLLSQSDPVRSFVSTLERVYVDAPSAVITSETLLESCREYIRGLNLDPSSFPTDRDIQRELNLYISVIHGLSQRGDIPGRTGKAVRGYVGLRLPKESEGKNSGC